MIRENTCACYISESTGDGQNKVASRADLLWAFACAKWGPVLRAPLEYYGFSIGTEWPVEKFGSSEIHRCTVGFPQTIS